ncbi:membrane protein [Bacteroidia bacterium]|nr:membrane protein [Bacteroidia bacterium]
MYGLGMLKDNYGPYAAMGGVSSAMRDGNNINFLNPASYTALDSNRFYLQFGIDGEYVQISTHTENMSYKVAQNSALCMALRFHRYVYGSFGFNQRANIGYDLYYYRVISGTGNEYYNQHISGAGGINDCYVGLATKFGNLSIGANASILFGNIEKGLTLTPSFPTSSSLDNSYNISSQTRTSITDFLIDMGAQYSFRPTAFSNLTVGATLNLPTHFNAEKNYLAYKINSSTSVQEVLNNETPQKGYIAYPFGFKTGVAYNYKDRWTVVGDYSFLQMSKYEEFKKSQDFDDYHKGAFGLSYLPARNGRFWWQHNSYNFGLYAVSSQLKLKDVSINTYGITAGVQIPVRIAYRELLLGIAFDYGIRGTQENGLIREQYGKIRLNVAFKETWFAKRKIY